MRINGRYRVVRPLGDGAEGMVILVVDEHAGQAERALKVVAGMDTEQRQRLAGEFRRLASLDHPRLVRVHDLDVVSAESAQAGLTPGTLFFTADYIAGHTPVAALAKRRDPLGLVLAMASDIAGALAHVHAAGLVHCDIKPANIMVQDAGEHGPRAMLLDLGLSTARGITGQARGTLAYMPPEALAGAVDPRSDLYALGATLYHAITGTPPFAAAEPHALIRAICEQSPRPVHADWLPAPLAACIMRLMAPELGHRHSSAHVLLHDLARIREALGLDMNADSAGRACETTGTRASRVAAPAALLPPRLVGREPVVTALTRAMDALGTDKGTAVRSIRLAGAPGSGRKAIISAAIRKHQLAMAADRAAPLTFLRGTAGQLGRSLGVDSSSPDMALALDTQGAERVADTAPLRWVDALLDRAQQHVTTHAPAVLILEDEIGEDMGAGKAAREALLRAAQAGHPGFARNLLLIATTAPARMGNRMPAEDQAGHAAGNRPGQKAGLDAGEAGHAVVEIAIEPLDADQVHEVIESMIGRAVDPAWSQKLARASGGLPRLVVEAVRAAAATAGMERIERVSVAELMSADNHLARLVVRRAAGLSAERAGVLEALAVHGGVANVHALCATLECDAAAIYAALAELRSAGFVNLDDEPMARTGHALARLPSAAHTRALHDAIPETRRKALHRAALAWCEARDVPDAIVRARHLIETGPQHRGALACARAAQLLWARGELDRALDMSRHAMDLAKGPAAADACILFARIATATGHYDDAIAAAGRAARSRVPARRRKARFALARALHKRGDLDAAEDVLRALVAEAENQAGADDPDAPDSHEAARGAYARLLVARGHHGRALAVAGEPENEPPLAGALGPGRVLRLESAGLARLYQADLDGADTAFLRLEQAARASADRALCGRALSLRGMVDHSRGHVAGAAERYRQAGIEARAAGDVHAAAVYDLNQATAHSERGRFGAALDALGTALGELARLGDVAELSAAQYNRGIALLALGEPASARRAATLALDHARSPQMAIYAELLSGDVYRREGHVEQALAAYQRACDQARDHHCERELLLARLNMAELLAEQNDRRAVDLLEMAAEHAHSADDRDRHVLCRARVALLLGTDATSPAAGARDHDDPIDALADVSRRARDSGRIDQAWRCDVLLARLCRARGQSDEAKRHVRAARALFEDMVMDAPESHRDGLRSDADACALAALTAELGLRPGRNATLDSNPAASYSTANLRRLLALSRRLNSQLSLKPLLDDVMDTAIEMTAAERGFLLLRHKNELDVVVARNFEQATLDGDDARMSRSIAERAARTGEVVLTVDAAFDDRFGEAASVAALKLRSVLAVPLRQKGQVAGTIYVDHRFRRSAFNDHAIELVQELADIAAVAIDNARLMEESRRRQEEIVALNRRLEAEVVEKDAELVRARLSADPSRGLRHEYPAIVGRSPAMLEMLRIIDRISDTHLPVVIFGESGTGKELVARALHHNGPRRQEPFVPINCGALPEKLLESELFGHVRGAFTGADRDRPGLFEVAHGGTLFLDEVADTTLAMQTKLLRVLQEGEIRRVGEARSRTVDVRVLAASNRRLEDLVATGAFREDLYYRLNVLHIDVPPLRERSQDIPVLAGHLLARLAGDKTPPEITQDALARLCSYAWPGNVRELENQLARAMALADEVIDVDTLSGHVKPEEPRRDPPADLRLKPQIEALERRLIEAAMNQTKGNQTAAAKLLGVSRYGLQKKLKRYGIAGSQP